MKLNQLCTQFAACAALTLAASTAHADAYLFTLTGSTTASWQMASSPTPAFANGNEFRVDGVPGLFNGNTVSMTLFFYASNFGGGMEIQTGNADVVMNGPQLFSGTTNAPTILAGGPYALTEFDGGAGRYSLTISEADPVGTVPEPATLALVLGGLGLMGYATASRRRAS